MEILKKMSPQLKEYQSWRGTERGEDITLLDFAGFVATPDILCAIYALFFPECILHRDRYFLANHFSESLYDQWIEKSESGMAVQKVLNHVHISTLIQNQSIPDLLACQCAQLLCAAWKCSLEGLDVTVQSGGTGYDDAYVTFYQS
jgi:hypothetical protein